jgi:hypothetical protein
LAESFSSKYDVNFDAAVDQWSLKVPSNDAVQVSEGFFEIKLPFYASRVLAVGGNILRPMRKAYRDWLLLQQGNICETCGEGPEVDNPWNLDHQPQLNDPESKFIDYERITENRVIHQKCNKAQMPKSGDGQL